MTCIVGLVERGRIWMGGDSAGVSGLDICDRVDSKVFAKEGMLFGFTWSFRMGQLLRYKLKVPANPEDLPIDAYMATCFVDALRDCLKQGGFATKEKEAETGGQFLVGYSGRLFCLESDYQVGERREGFNACGCGSSYALGSLYSTVGLKSEIRVREALRAAAKFSAGVRAPFTILSSKEVQKKECAK